MHFKIENSNFSYNITFKPGEYDGRILKTVEERVLYTAELAIQWCHANDVSFFPILLVLAGKNRQYEVNVAPILLDLGLYETYARVDKNMREAIKEDWIINKIKCS